jgi:uncharacterized protein
VTNQRHPLRINVGFLLNQPAGAYREMHFSFPEIVLTPDLNLEGLQGTIKLNRTPQGVLAECHFEATQLSTCVRCLRDTRQGLVAQFAELFSFEAHPTSEAARVIPQNGNIDLEPILREYFLVELPIKTLCREDCKGLCQVCGENLNLTTCEHVQEGRV